MANRTTRHYPLLLALAPVLALVCVGLFNYATDPYRLFSSNESALYENYPALHPNLRLHKAYQVNLQKPDTIILGTSKAIQGIPLDHSYFDGKSVYNLAAPLASMREIYYLLMHAQANKPLQEVIFVIDFLSFNVLARADGPAAGFVEARLQQPGKHEAYWPDYLAAIVSADALMASVDVIRASSKSTHRVLNGRGGREDAEIAGRLSDGGHRSNSQKIESFFVDSVLLAAPHRRFAMADKHDNSLAWFEKLVTELQKQQIKTTLLIGPSHSRYWELINQANLWTQYEQWKEQLMMINQEVAAEFNHEPYTLWDFTLPNKITSEAFPAAGDSETRMKYYYEAVHFNQYAGGLVLDRVSGKAMDNLPENFGVPINQSTLPQINQQLRTGLNQILTQSPELVEELQRALPH